MDGKQRPLAHQEPVGTIAANGIRGFSGALDGNGYALSNLTIRRGSANLAGLFGVASGAI